MPHVEVTAMLTSPTGLAGAVAVIDVPLTTLNVAGVPPNVTDVAPVKFWPVMVIVVVPSAAPVLDDSEDKIGTAHALPVKVNALLNVVVPVALVTAIAAIPAVPDGDVNVSWVSETALTLVAADPPTVTPVVPVKFVPTSVTEVPPVEAPLTGATESIAGAALNERAYSNKFGDPLPGLPTILGVAALVNAATTWAGVAPVFNPR